MTMLLLVFRQSFNQDLQQLLRKLDVTSFTEALKAFGMGQARGASACLAWPGHNSIIPMRVFALPCERLL
jgi:hypothetical protein